MLAAGQAAAQGWQEQEVAGFTLRWATTGTNALSVELTRPTTGWVAAGFDPDSMMFGANIIIGYYSGGTFMRDDYGWQLTSHRDETLLGGTSDVVNDGGGEAGGEMEIKFTIPLDSGASTTSRWMRGRPIPSSWRKDPTGPTTSAHLTNS